MESIHVTNEERIELDKLMASAMNCILENSVVTTTGPENNPIQKIDIFVEVPRFYDKQERNSYKALYNIAVLTANLYGAEFHFVGSWFDVFIANLFIKKNKLYEPIIKGKRVKYSKHKIDLKSVALKVYLHIVKTLETKPMTYGPMTAFEFLYKAYYAE